MKLVQADRLAMKNLLKDQSVVIKYYNHNNKTNFINAINTLLNQPKNGIKLSSCTKGKKVYTYSFNFIENYKDLKISLNIIIIIYKPTNKTLSSKQDKTIDEPYEFRYRNCQNCIADTYYTENYKCDIKSYISVLSNDEENKSEIVHYNLLLNELCHKHQMMFSDYINGKNESLDDISEDMVESRRFWCNFNLNKDTDITFEAMPKLSAIHELKRFIKDFIATDIIEEYKNVLDNASCCLKEHITKVRNISNSINDCEPIKIHYRSNYRVDKVLTEATSIWFLRYLAYDTFKKILRTKIIPTINNDYRARYFRDVCHIYGNILTPEIVNNKKFLKLFKYDIIKEEYAYMLKAKTFFKHHEILGEFFDINDLKKIFSNKLPRNVNVMYSLFVRG
jgi:hypothetical protein